MFVFSCNQLTASVPSLKAATVGKSAQFTNKLFDVVMVTGLDQFPP